MRRTLAILAAIVLTRRSGHGPVRVLGMVRPGRPMKRELVGWLLIATVASFVPFAHISAQSIPIAECEAPCPLVVELAGTFGDDEGPGMLGEYVRGFPGNNGRWYLVDNPPTAVKVYDGAGGFLHRFGRSGEGPGEFSLIRSVLQFDDGVVAVLDDPSGLKFFDSAGKLLRETRLPFAPTSNGVVYADGLGMVIAANVPTPERTGLPLHVVDLDDGSVGLSFGSLTGEYRLSDAGGMSRVLAEGPAGAVWAARRYEYRIELWTPDGLERSLVRDVPWFPAATLSTLAHGWSERPNAILGSLAATGSQLWVKLQVADERWQDASEANPGNPDRDGIFDTIIEVIDLDALRVIGRVRLDEEFSNFVAPGMIGRTAVTPAGSVRYQVYRISTETPPR